MSYLETSYDCSARVKLLLDPVHVMILCRMEIHIQPHNNKSQSSLLIKHTSGHYLKLDNFFIILLGVASFLFVFNVLLINSMLSTK